MNHVVGVPGVVRLEVLQHAQLNLYICLHNERAGALCWPSMCASRMPAVLQKRDAPPPAFSNAAGGLARVLRVRSTPLAGRHRPPLAAARAPHLRLVVEALLVADDLERAVGARLVVQHLDHLAKAALAQHAQDLVAVRRGGEAAW